MERSTSHNQTSIRTKIKVAGIQLLVYFSGRNLYEEANKKVHRIT